MSFDTDNEMNYFNHVKVLFRNEIYFILLHCSVINMHRIQRTKSGVKVISGHHQFRLMEWEVAFFVALLEIL